jgi:hypothetical protein
LSPLKNVIISFGKPLNPLIMSSLDIPYSLASPRSG